MVRVKTVILMTPDEFRNILPEKLQGLFDRLVLSLTEGSALSEKEAKGLIAQMMLDALRKEIDETKAKVASEL